MQPILHAFFFELLSRDSEALDPDSGNVKDDRLHSLIYTRKTVILENAKEQQPLHTTYFRIQFSYASREKHLLSNTGIW